MIPPLSRLPALSAGGGRGSGGWVALAFLLATLGLRGATDPVSGKIPARPVFERDIRPILRPIASIATARRRNPRAAST